MPCVSFDICMYGLVLLVAKRNSSFVVPMCSLVYVIRIVLFVSVAVRFCDIFSLCIAWCLRW